MKLRHKINGGTVTVDDDFGKRLLAGQWEEVKDTKSTSSRRKKTDAGSDDNDG